MSLMQLMQQAARVTHLPGAISAGQHEFPVLLFK
jgi:hypothetical protein